MHLKFCFIEIPKIELEEISFGKYIFVATYEVMAVSLQLKVFTICR